MTRTKGSAERAKSCLKTGLPGMELKERKYKYYKLCAPHVHTRKQQGNS